MNSIPIDLFHEIFTRLPAKSIGKFCCVSKQWASILDRQDFTELFLTRSSTRPRLLFAVQRYGEWLFFSSPQTQNPYEKSSLALAADFHIKLRLDEGYYRCEYTSGLIYFSGTKSQVICNPITGQHAILPKADRELRSFFGFDPIDKQYKVLLINKIGDDERAYHILTLGSGIMRWRMIQCPFTHYVYHTCKRICINGVLYYLAGLPDERYKYGSVGVIVCFDVRFEKFTFIDGECFTDGHNTILVNYKGKLGGISMTYDKSDVFELRICVLEDVEKQEWSKRVHFISRMREKVIEPWPWNIYVVGVTATGEIVLSEKYTHKPSYVYYFNHERNTLKSVEIQGVGEYKEWFNQHRVYYAFSDHVENLSFDDSEQLKSSFTQ
ncbi:PREDICTED: putative F-box protein At5g42430 [Camelina sativa]|uniref:F-box protein At5g42430 n=1 Tax=Camelina sativa TaxID=90675 RepID=A0ABM0X502_CAMSA|nr:PREDICTED: putative F-box protein At5g42430 [Camelina sativa]